jgi:general secretion pathway protein A
MYKSFYKLNKKPFETKTDPSFLWLGEKHKEALATLRYGIMNNMGFLLLTGDVGTGKTTLINALIQSLPKNVIYTYISDPGLSSADFYNYIAFSFKIKIGINSKSDFLIIFKKFLLKAAQADKKILLIIDESQILSEELLEQIRLLSNIDIGETDILNIFFIGQPEFNHTLLKEKNRAVRQRISLNYDILPFSFNETKEYINYRLKISGAKYEIFSNSAVKKIYLASKGFPRRINIICDHCLLSGFVKDNTIINKKIALECIKELSLPDEPKKRNLFKSKLFSNNFIKAAFSSFIFFILIFFGYLNFDFLKNFILKPNSTPNVQSEILKTSSNTLENQIKEKTSLKHEDKPKDPEPVSETEKQTDVFEPEIKKEPLEEVKSVKEHKTDETPIDKKEISQKTEPFKEKTFTLRFKYNTNEFEESELSKIKECAGILKKYPNSKALVTGYTDSLGYSQYNMKLSEFRANIIKGYLIGNGVKAEKIEVKGMGDKNPVEKNSSAWGRKMNRRVEVFIYQNSN